MDITLKDLGLSGQPNESIYKNLMKFSNFLLNTVLANTFEMSGEENLREDCFQIFLCNHLYYTDPVLAQMAIVLASQNDNPIPAPAYKTYVKHKILGPIMVSLFSFPIYGKEDGYTQRENSLQYCFQCFLRQQRILIFPEGQIAHDGEFITGKFGAAEIARRAYHALNDIKSGNYKEKIKIIPMNISYYPTPGVPLSETGKISVQFGRAIDVKEDFIDRFYSPFHPFSDEIKLKRSLQAKLMKKVTHEIGLLTTININQVISWIIYELAQNKHLMIDKYKFDNILKEYKFEDVRDKNIIFYNRNLINHLDDFKRISQKKINKEL